MRENVLPPVTFESEALGTLLFIAGQDVLAGRKRARGIDSVGESDIEIKSVTRHSQGPWWV